YLVGQVVGAGKLIQLLFGLDYVVAVVLVSALMMIYVMFGGMLATTWVQFIKAVLLIVGISMVGFLLLQHYQFSLTNLFSTAAEVHPKGQRLFEPGGLLKSGGDILSLAVTAVLGFIGLPHILMRLFTVKDGRAARKSAFYATGIMGYVYVLIILIGFGAVGIVMGNPDFFDDQGNMIGGNNMLVLHVTQFLGDDALLGFMSAVTFATILAVVAGLTLAGAAAVAHDIYGQVICRGNPSEKRELQISRVTVVVLGVISILLGIAFEHQNVVFIATAALAISASVNAPVLLLGMYWRKLTTRGAVAGIVVGLISCLVLIVLSPLVMEEVLGNDKALFPYQYPTLISAPLAFIAAYVFSISDKSNRAVMEHRKFDDQFVRAETGVGIDAASGH
ncbi:MAG: cation acetate symporter, partial [Pseudomonadota bacterium]